MSHFACMLDIETLGTGLNCAIVSIGATVCDLEDRRGFMLIDSFERKINIPGQKDRVIEGETLLWWLRQSEEARMELTNTGRVGLWMALKDFWTWYRVEAPRACNVGKLDSVWSKGVDFDVAIIGAAFKGASQDEPWHYHDRRCLRTVAALFPSIAAAPVTAHTALQDAKDQLEHLWRIWGKLFMTMKGNL